jgi:hypothetical protein
VWAGIVLSAAFPFALGAALALLAMWALQARRHWRFALLAALTLAASPLAFLLLALLLAGFGIARWRDRAALLVPGLTIAVFGLVEVVLWRLFPGGRYPFSFAELAAALTFCILGAGVTWRVERARSLRWVFVVYLGACIAAYLIPSALGENVARLRYAAVPVGVLILTLRRWRPLPVCLGAFLLAVAWNVSPIASQFLKGSSDPATKAAYWAPAISFLRAHLVPAYRVEAVDTTGHWAAVYLAEAQIPVARGGFRQDDFPQNELLYDDLAPGAYVHWLRNLGVRYVVLSNAPTDYSAKGEAALLRSRRSGLSPVFRTRDLTIFAVPRPTPILTGPVPGIVRSLTATHVVVDLPSSAQYRLAVRFSPFWHAKNACLSRSADGMTLITPSSPGRLELSFRLNAGAALAAVGGRTTVCNGRLDSSR